MSSDNQESHGAAEAAAERSVSSLIADAISDGVEPRKVKINGKEVDLYFRAATEAQFQALMKGQSKDAKSDDIAKARARFLVATLREKDGSPLRNPDGSEFTIHHAAKLKPGATAAIISAALDVAGFGKEQEEDAGKD